MLFDTDELVKVHGYEILLGITEEYLGREKVANDIIIKRLVEFLATENGNIKICIAFAEQLNVSKSWHQTVPHQRWHSQN